MRKFFVAAAIAITFLGSSVSSADASFRIRASNNGGATYFLDVTDNGAGDILNTTDGVILAVGVSAGATINVNTGSTKPAIGSASSPAQALNFSVSQLAGGLAQTITIEVTDTGYTPLAGNLSASIGGTLTTGKSTVLDDAYASSTNGEFSTTSATHIALGTFSGPPNFSGSGILPQPASAPYSLTQRITITLAAGGSSGYDTSGNASLSAVPAPAGLVLALTGMPVLGIGAWVRRRTRIAA